MCALEIVNSFFSSSNATGATHFSAKDCDRHGDQCIDLPEDAPAPSPELEPSPAILREARGSDEGLTEDGGGRGHVEGHGVVA